MVKFQRELLSSAVEKDSLWALKAGAQLWPWLKHISCRNFWTDWTKVSIKSFSLLSKKKNSMFVDCRKNHLHVFLTSIWRHLELSYSSRSTVISDISWGSGLKSVMYLLLETSLQKWELVSDASLQAYAAWPQPGLWGATHVTGLCFPLKSLYKSEEGFQSKAAAVGLCPCKFVIVLWHWDPLYQERGIISARCSRWKHRDFLFLSEVTSSSVQAGVLAAEQKAVYSTWLLEQFQIDSKYKSVACSSKS